MDRAEETSIDRGDDTRTGSYDYHLPAAQIGQHPAETCDESRMLVLNRTTGDFADHIFRDITEYPRREDVLVLNNTKVFPRSWSASASRVEGRPSCFSFALPEMECGMPSPGRGGS